MKRTRTLRILGIALILALLLAVVPVTPALAVYDLTLSPTSTVVGATVTVSGTTFPATTTLILYLSNQSATAGQLIGTNVTVYDGLKQTTTNASGAFSTTFIVPSTYSSDNSAITSGTNYFYACDTSNTILGISTLTITTGSITLNPTSGATGAAVNIIGSGFTSGTTITATFGGNAIVIEGGHTAVQTNGSFISTIYVPSSATVGAHTVAVTAGTTASATFTVTASGALDPLTPASGPPGTSVQVTGANFPASTAIVYQFDSTTITPTSGDTVTRAGGIIISTIAIPASATAGSHTITVTVGSQTASATFTVSASASLDALTPTSGAGGTSVIISGANFPASTVLVITFDSTTLTPTSGHTSTTSGGMFLSTVTVPAAATAGAHTITVTAGTGTASATFTVSGGATTTPPTGTANPLDINYIDTNILVTASGFTPGGGVQIYYDDVLVDGAAANADTSGIIAILVAPPTTHGDHVIKAVDLTNPSIVAETTYNVEEVPPAAPQPLLPAVGAEVNTNTVFDWADSTDDASPPVTYDFQISNSPTFAEGTILVNKTGLTLSTYTMTEQEQLNITSQAIPYYWRARAVDAAENASDWTGSATFYIGGGSGLPSWALYTILGIGAVLLFGIGYWLGRRTAYYY